MNTKSSAGSRRCLAVVQPVALACFLLVAAVLAGCGGKEQGPDAAIVVEIQALKDENQRLGKRLDSLQKSLGDRDEAMVEVDRLAKQLAVLARPDENVELLKPRLAQIENNLERTMTEVADTVQAVRALAGRPAADPRIADAQADLQELSAKVDESEDRNDALSAENERLKRRMQTMENGLDESGRKIKALENGLDGSRKKVKELEADLNDALASAKRNVVGEKPVVVGLAPQAEQPAVRQGASANSKDIEIQHSEKVLTAGKSVSVEVSGYAINTGDAVASRVQVCVSVHWKGSRNGVIVVNTRGGSKTVEMRNLRPGESRPFSVVIPYSGGATPSEDAATILTYAGGAAASEDVTTIQWLPEVTAYATLR
jgi:regulator of replication initiation timing